MDSYYVRGGESINSKSKYTLSDEEISESFQREGKIKTPYDSPSLVRFSMLTLGKGKPKKNRTLGTQASARKEKILS